MLSSLGLGDCVELTSVNTTRLGVASRLLDDEYGMAELCSGISYCTNTSHLSERDEAMIKHFASAVLFAAMVSPAVAADMSIAL